MKKLIGKFTVCLLAITLFAGCTGKQGPQGPAGTNGANGTANISSWTFTTGSFGGSSGNWYYVQGVSAITDMNTNLVEMYAYSNTYTEWLALPLANLYANGDLLTFGEYTGGVDLHYYGTSNPGAITFKVVVIPPAVMKKHPNTNWKDYSQVKALVDVQNTFKN